MRPALGAAPSGDLRTGEAGRVGFFGKMPGRGDFVRRDLPNAFVDKWDEWLTECIARSRAALGHGWTDAWLCAPVWRFGLGGGLCGPTAWAGVMMASVDSAGRYFPLTLVAPVDGVEVPTALLIGGWIDALENTAISALDDATGFDGFAGAVSALPAPVSSVESSYEGARAIGNALDPMGFASLLSASAVLRGGRALFVTRGGERVAPASVLFPGLPSPSRFSEMIEDGDTQGVIANALPQAPAAAQVIPTDEFQSLAADLPPPAEGDTLFDDVAFGAAEIDAVPPPGGAFDDAVVSVPAAAISPLPSDEATLFDEAAFGAPEADPATPTGGAFDDGDVTLDPVHPPAAVTVRGPAPAGEDDLFGVAPLPAIDNLFGDEDGAANAGNDTLSAPREAPR